MLSISMPMRGGGSGDYYLKLAQAGYYANAVAPPGKWFGKGAEILKLPTQVTPTALKHLLEGKSPDGATQFVQLQQWKNRERQSGWDLTFSAPKSVSVLWSQSLPEVRAQIEAAHQCAVKTALKFLEDEAAITRRGKGGRIHERAKVVFAMFEHGTSRANEPQIHTHAVLVNLTIRKDGSTGALQSKMFFELKLAAGAVYQLELRKQFADRLHLQMQRGAAAFQLTEVPKEVCRRMSSRRVEIEKKLDELKDHSAKTAERVARATRPAKHELPLKELFPKWQEIGRAIGWGPEEAARVVREAEAKEKRLAPIREKLQSAQVEQLLRQASADANLRQPRIPSQVADDGKKALQGTAQGRHFMPKHGGSILRKALARLPETPSSNRSGDATQRSPELRGLVSNEADLFWTKAAHAAAEDRLFAKQNSFYAAAKNSPLRWETRLMFPRAPEWSPFKNWRSPLLVIGEKKSTQWWGKVRFEVKTPLGVLQFRDRRLFPHAPEWSPFKHFAIPRLVYRPDTHHMWRDVLWKRNTPFGQMQLCFKALFPHAIEGSFAHRLALPAFRLRTDRQKYKNEDVKPQQYVR